MSLSGVISGGLSALVKSVALSAINSVSAVVNRVLGRVTSGPTAVDAHHPRMADSIVRNLVDAGVAATSGATFLGDRTAAIVSAGAKILTGETKEEVAAQIETLIGRFEDVVKLHPDLSSWIASQAADGLGEKIVQRSLATMVELHGPEALKEMLTATAGPAGAVVAAFILNQAIINQPENQRGGEEKYRFMADAFHFAVADQPSESLKDRAAGWIAAAPNVAADGIHGVRDWVSTKAMVNIATEFTEPGKMRDLLESSVGKETMEKLLNLGLNNLEYAIEDRKLEKVIATMAHLHGKEVVLGALTLLAQSGSGSEKTTLLITAAVDKAILENPDLVKDEDPSIRLMADALFFAVTADTKPLEDRAVELLESTGEGMSAVLSFVREQIPEKQLVALAAEKLDYSVLKYETVKNWGTKIATGLLNTVDGVLKDDVFRKTLATVAHLQGKEATLELLRGYLSKATNDESIITATLNVVSRSVLDNAELAQPQSTQYLLMANMVIAGTTDSNYLGALSRSVLSPENQRMASEMYVVGAAVAESIASHPDVKMASTVVSNVVELAVDITSPVVSAVIDTASPVLTGVINAATPVLTGTVNAAKPALTGVFNVATSVMKGTYNSTLSGAAAASQTYQATSAAVSDTYNAAKSMTASAVDSLIFTSIAAYTIFFPGTEE